MKIMQLEAQSHVTIQVHVQDNVFTTEACVAKINGSQVILRLLDLEQFDKLAEKSSVYSLCYKAGFEINHISNQLEMKHSASNPYYVAVDGQEELSPVHAVRSHVRYPYEHELVLTLGEAMLTVHSIDISTSGLGAISKRSIPHGAIVYIDIYNPLNKKSKAFRAKIANCTQLRLNEYRVGVLFEQDTEWITDFINDLQNKVLQDMK